MFRKREVISINTAVISKEDILQVCRDLIREKGWEAVNIRAVAGACDISVGSVYNYFRSKSDLIAAAVESVWCDIFHKRAHRFKVLRNVLCLYLKV